MGTRHDLQSILEAVPGVQEVYFQPPSSITLKYPCIVYTLSNKSFIYADDLKYSKKNRYQLMVIDKNPDSLIPDSIENLIFCSFDRHYTADNLHHFVYDLYF